MKFKKRKINLVIKQSLKSLKLKKHYNKKLKSGSTINNH